MILSDIGKIAQEEWLKSEHVRQNIKLDVFVIMPNHMHGIVVIDNQGRDALRDVSTGINAETSGSDAPQRVSTVEVYLFTAASG